jgi:small subunit ribosomal protein S4
LDNVIRRAGFSATRPQARQGVAHGHFQVNGRICDRPSYLVRPGDVISVRPRENLKNVYRSLLGESNSEPIDWIAVDADNLSLTVQGLPGPSDISLPVDVNTVVELVSR